MTKKNKNVFLKRIMFWLIVYTIVLSSMITEFRIMGTNLALVICETLFTIGLVGIFVITRKSYNVREKSEYSARTSIYKSVGRMKVSGIAILIYDLSVIIFMIYKKTGMLLEMDEILSLTLELLVGVAVQMWWYLDALKWIPNKKNQRYVWNYSLIEAIIITFIIAISKVGMMATATVVIYMMMCYITVGIIWMLRYKLVQHVS